MKGIDKLFIATVCTLFLCSCSQDRRQAKGFVLPKGDIEKGKSEFVNLGCHQCHTVANVKLPNPPKTSEVTFALGGEVSRVKTYGELVTSIIQPQHVLEPSILGQ